jgi:hypothetical protein
MDSDVIYAYNFTDYGQINTVVDQIMIAELKAGIAG